ncbi:hypothetical protein HK097_002234 [Rhizophlyctis rosea]|uniref:Major facilitator superfamily (MFS) profile domain-containing protein n=1 Tax=Rhizophlyctis rosea TaxID=64517 RepID=A0AAD5S3K7_9FUNG|nr:hypothetical protein HK097_002234 [Rhizophlyctis rosea]
MSGKHLEGNTSTITLTDLSAPPAIVTEATEPSNDPVSTLIKLRLFSACLCFATAGVNDSSIGPLIPYIMPSYGVGTDIVALVFVPNLLGWLLAAGIGSHAHAIVSPNFPLFAFTFFLTGLGQALQDSQANTYVSSLPSSQTHRFLGLIHAMYGVGLLLGPPIATAVASNSRDWRFTYAVLIGLGIVNFGIVIGAFWGMVKIGKKSEEGNGGEGKKATKNLRSALGSKVVWIMSLFYFFYLGAVISLSGWIVEFLVQIRGGELAKMGYMPMAMNGGTVLGRLFLADVTHRFGERKMVAIYIVVCIIAQVIFWQVNSIAVAGVMLVVIGFFSGPLFAAVSV